MENSSKYSSVLGSKRIKIREYAGGDHDRTVAARFAHRTASAGAIAMASEYAASASTHLAREPAVRAFVAKAAK